jgi:hypothetical protein
MDWTALAIQSAASITTIASSWAYGSKRSIGPYLGILSQAPWWTLMVYEGLWGLLPVNGMMLVIHIRNYVSWKREEL